MLILICQNSIYCLGRSIKYFNDILNFLYYLRLNLNLGFFWVLFYFKQILYSKYLNKRKRENTTEHVHFSYSLSYNSSLQLLATDAQKELNTIPHFAFLINFKSRRFL